MAGWSLRPAAKMLAPPLVIAFEECARNGEWNRGPLLHILRGPARLSVGVVAYVVVVIVVAAAQQPLMMIVTSCALSVHTAALHARQPCWTPSVSFRQLRGFHPQRRPQRASARPRPRPTAGTARAAASPSWATRTAACSAWRRHTRRRGRASCARM